MYYLSVYLHCVVVAGLGEREGVKEREREIWNLNYVNKCVNMEENLEGVNGKQCLNVIKKYFLPPMLFRKINGNYRWALLQYYKNLDNHLTMSKVP